MDAVYLQNIVRLFGGIIPLGSKAELTLKDKALADLPKGNYELILTDISGIAWKQDLTY